MYVLQNERIGYAGDSLGEVAAHFESIDLQDNLLWEWKEVT